VWTGSGSGYGLWQAIVNVGIWEQFYLYCERYKLVSGKELLTQ